MLSMTGFGSGEGTRGPWSVTVELRSVNHRFLDVALKLPTAAAPFEIDIRNFLKDHVARGRVTVSVQLQTTRDALAAGLDPARLDQALAMVRAVAARVEQETGRPQTITLDHLLTVPDLFRGEEPELDPADVKTALMAALAEAQRGLRTMKEREGAALVAVMRQRLDSLDLRLDEVRVLAPQAAEEIRSRLEERLEKLLSEPLDPQRLAQEVVILADKANINEECERLGIHIAAFRAALDEGGQVAKRLNFLLQVMKDEVESLREQIQNLE
jgi:uncharacterized protein (TIGR00255 family)